MAMKLADYTITEAGFGADLGAEKFMDIKCRKAGIKPDAVVIVATIKALKYHGGVEKDKIQEENIAGLQQGMNNLFRHIENLKDKFGLNVIVAINKYNTDTIAEIEYVQGTLKEKNVEVSLVEGWAKGGEGAIDIAQKIANIVDEKDCSSVDEECNDGADKNINFENGKQENNLKFIYDLSDGIKEKIEKIAKEIYGAEGVKFEEEALVEIERIEKMGYREFPVCIAKTQYSFSDDSKNLECKEPFKITIREINLKAGAGFVVAIAGKIMTMPGLPRIPAAEQIDIDGDGKIVGIF